MRMRGYRLCDIACRSLHRIVEDAVQPFRWLGGVHFIGFGGCLDIGFEYEYALVRGRVVDLAPTKPLSPLLAIIPFEVSSQRWVTSNCLVAGLPTAKADFGQVEEMMWLSLDSISSFSSLAASNCLTEMVLPPRGDGEEGEVAFQTRDPTKRACRTQDENIYREKGSI